MTDFDMPEPTKLMLVGDTHGDWDRVARIMSRARHESCDAIIQLGDFGYWAGLDNYVDKVKAKAALDKIPFYWLDGNHEYHIDLIPGQGDQYFRHLPRGHRWQWWGKTWMSVGGGVSVDKEIRTPGQNWFPEETLSSAQVEYCCRQSDPFPVDIILSHDCPSGVKIPSIHAEEKTGESWSAFPPEAIRESENHRKLISMICEDTHPKLLVHGHYHCRYEGITPDAKVGVIGLGDNRGPLKEQVVVMTKEAVSW